MLDSLSEMPKCRYMTTGRKVYVHKRREGDKGIILLPEKGKGILHKMPKEEKSLGLRFLRQISMHLYPAIEERHDLFRSGEDKNRSDFSRTRQY